MNDVIRFDFFSSERRNPYIQKIIEHSISDKKGYLYFDGYYYVSDLEFPKSTFLNISITTKIGVDDNEPKYKLLQDTYYKIEIYKREHIKNTSEYGEMIDEDGSTMKVCLFPTHEQKLYFKILEEFDTFEDFLDKCAEHFTKELE
jgi:hypothetical protein